MKANTAVLRDNSVKVNLTKHELALLDSLLAIQPDCSRAELLRDLALAHARSIALANSDCIYILNMSTGTVQAPLGHLIGLLEGRNHAPSYA